MIPNPLAAVGLKAWLWVSLAALVVVAGLGFSQYLRARGAEADLRACIKESERRGAQVEEQNDKLKAAAAAASAVKERGEELLQEAEGKTAALQGQVDILEAKLRRPTGNAAKTCGDALKDIRSLWKRATP